MERKIKLYIKTTDNGIMREKNVNEQQEESL